MGSPWVRCHSEGRVSAEFRLLVVLAQNLDPEKKLTGQSRVTSCPELLGDL